MENKRILRILEKKKLSLYKIVYFFFVKMAVGNP